MNSHIGIVAIGRNEGERLRRCLSSVLGRAGKIVYVDSGSTDGSVAMARSMGVEVVELDMSQPFTAARARNAGFARVADCVYVQFVDGDCEIVAGWIELAVQQLEENLNWAIVCGRRREQHLDASIYNRLCDIEWDTPVGEAHACGGDAMVRVAAFQQVGGYNPDGHSRRRAGDVRASSPGRLDNSSLGRRDDPARCRDNALRPVVEAQRPCRPRLCRRRRHAR